MAHGRERPARPLWPEGAPGPDPGKEPGALLLATRVELAALISREGQELTESDIN